MIGQLESVFGMTIAEEKQVSSLFGRSKLELIRGTKTDVIDGCGRT
jgi:hypothetical protein